MRRLAGIEPARQAIETEVPGVLGVHIEGPFLNVRRKGIHDASKLRRTDDSSFALLTSLGLGRIARGCFADLVLLDDDLQVLDPWIHGHASAEADAAAARA